MESITHSWYGKYTHVFRSDGRVVRARVQKIFVDRGSLLLRVSFAGHTKDMSPIAIAALQVMWINVDVVSDDADIDQTQDFQLPPECDFLGPLQIPNIPHDPMLASTILQVNHFITLTEPQEQIEPHQQQQQQQQPRPVRRRRARNRRVQYPDP